MANVLLRSRVIYKATADQSKPFVTSYRVEATPAPDGTHFIVSEKPSGQPEDVWSPKLLPEAWDDVAKTIDQRHWKDLADWVDHA